MKINRMKIIIATIVVLLTFNSCSLVQKENNTEIKEEDKNNTIIENENNDTDKPSITVEKIDKYEGMEITDWLDEQTVILSKENPELGKMTLLENLGFYPRSIYLYNLNTKEYKIVKAQKDMFLGGATLSPDKKNLLYYEYSIGDIAYYLMSMDLVEEQSAIKDDVIGIAISAQWTDNENIIGISYAGGAYLSDTDRNIIHIPELQGEQLYSVEKSDDKVYYVMTDGDFSQLYMFNMLTKEKKNLKLENTVGITLSSDGKLLLITQWTGHSKKLLIADTEGKILETIAEGNELTGVSWSPNQQMIAFHLKSIVDGVEGSGIYLYDISAGKSIRIAANIDNAKISWSPSSNKIAFTEFHESNYNSSIIYLK
ncbi:hypothetical protein [Proteiniborus sp. MB09-C3]|uniref:TolB family protein n=1 Tax=Proteiniborus sp. MB09-C3 TaxID=3050072 RepID=UPI002552DEDD|nr:hypothetical protein [Proteiniborus sp. MB09-C3]WIV13680.1 hypothetical protein QO263_08290 [Proteiniborus sp. MB09-C3]